MELPVVVELRRLAKQSLVEARQECRKIMSDAQHNKKRALKAASLLANSGLDHLFNTNGSGTLSEETPEPTRKRRRMSAASRKRISDAVKKRWAKARSRGRTSLSR